MEATRELGLYSDSYWLMYLMSVVSMGIFARGVHHKFRAWCQGAGDFRDRFENLKGRTIAFLRNLITHKRFSDRPSKISHALIVSAFALFLFGTLSIFLQEHFDLPVYQGGVYLCLSLSMDIFGILAFPAVIFAGWKRWRFLRGEGRGSTAEILPFVLIIFILVTGFALEGMRMSRTSDPWALWSPVGYSISTYLSFGQNEYLQFHQGIWWLHLAASLIFISLIPHTRLLHLLTSPASIFLGNEKAAVTLSAIDFERENEKFGVARIEDFHWKHLLELDACTECGQCQESCPAYLTGKSLSPQRLNRELKKCLESTVKQTAYSYASRKDNSTKEKEISITRHLVEEDVLWACTTCRSCEVNCPVMVEHVPRIVDMRRNLVMMEARVPHEAHLVFRGFEGNYNPWNFDRKTRSDWRKTLTSPPPLISETPDAEYLFWPGCAGAFDERNRKVVNAFVKIMQIGEIDFAVLGNEERCCGDSVRRMGNEYLYQSLAKLNIDTFKKYGIKKIITTCPHCFNTFRNEYPQLGGEFEVFHHSEVIDALIKDGRIQTEKGCCSPDSRVTFHDSCYLARYNDIKNPPRDIIETIFSASVQELPRNREKTFCCGGGGGRMWMEEKVGSKICEERINEILNAGITTVTTGCPFCLTMLGDALKKYEGNFAVEVFDVAELVEASLVATGEIDRLHNGERI